MSFAQEMKDFFAAAAAGQKMIGAVSDEHYKQAKQKYLEAQTQTVVDKNNDTVGQELDREAKRAVIRSRNAATALTGKRGQLVDAQRATLAAPTGPDPMLGEVHSTMDTPTVDATPTAPASAIGGPDAAPAVSADVPVQGLTSEAGMYSRGGAVQRFADGGAVGEAPVDDTEELPAPAPAAQPAVGGDEALSEEGASDEGDPAEGASGDTDFSSRNRSGAPKFSADAALDAGRAGLKYGVQALGLDSRAAVTDPHRSRRLGAYARGAGAAQPTDLVAVRKAIDPEGKLGESAANLAALGAVYQFKMNKGDEAGAQRAAFAMIQHYRVASQQYAAMTAAAVEHGDIDNAIKLAMKSYANVPDGKDLKLEKAADGKLSYSFTDEKTGKVVSRGLETPDKLAASAMGFARGQGFDAALLAAAGQKPEKPAVDPNAAPMKAADKKTVLGQINDAYTEQNPDDPKTGEPKYAPDVSTLLKGASFRIAAHTQNSRLTPNEAVAAATKIADPQALETSGFRTKKADGGYQVTFEGKQPVFVPEATFATLLAKRNAKLAELKKQKEEADKPGILARGANAIGGAISSGLHKLSDMREANEQALRRKDFTEAQIP